MASDHPSNSQHLRPSAPEFKPNWLTAQKQSIAYRSKFQNMSQLEQDLIKQLKYLITSIEELETEKLGLITERKDNEKGMQWLANIIDKCTEKEYLLKKENKDLLAEIATLKQDKCDDLQCVQPINSFCVGKLEKFFNPESRKHRKFEAEKLDWISERENMKIKIQQLRKIIAKYKETESVVKTENADLLAEIENLKQKNAMPEKRDELLRAHSANNLWQQGEARKSEATVIVSQSSDKDNHNNSICTFENMPKNIGIKIVGDSSKLDNAKHLEEDRRDTAITNHFNEKLNTSMQSSDMFSIKLSTDSPTTFTSSMLNESFDSQCCRKLKKQNELLKQIIKSQKERRQEREIRIKDLNLTLKSLRSCT